MFVNIFYAVHKRSLAWHHIREEHETQNVQRSKYIFNAYESNLTVYLAGTEARIVQLNTVSQWPNYDI